MENLKNKTLFEKFQKIHLDEGGTMSLEYALTELVHDAVQKKEYVYLPLNKKITLAYLRLYDVICYTNFSNDIFFGVLKEIDSNVLYVYTGTKDGIIKKVIEA
jgi:hypothetical protein